MGFAVLSSLTVFLVDSILFLTADVDVTPNANEIRDHKYVDKAELQAMFQDESESTSPLLIVVPIADENS